MTSNVNWILYVGQCLLPIALVFTLSGLTHYFFWMRKNQFTEKNSIQKIPFKPADLKREFRQSMRNMLFYGVVTGFVLSPIGIVHTKLYWDPMKYGALWLVSSMVMLLLMHDTWFYLVHYTLHHPRIFKYIHKSHHLSTNPSPLASQAVHLVELVLIVSFLIPVVLLIPIPVISYYVFVFSSVVVSIASHSNIEIYPDSWKTHPILKYVLRPTDHNAHHRYFEGNYGYFFTFWDRVFKTQRPE